MEVFTGNCRYSLYSMLKGTLLSYNSGCQVSERRLWDCASLSLGLLNWLCYCRPVQGEGSARESGLWYIRCRAFNCDPPPTGRVFTAALSGEGDLALDPSLCFSQRTPNPHPPILSRPSRSLLSSQRSFSTPSLSFLLPPQPPSFSPSFSQHPFVRLAQQGAANSLRSANFHTFPAWDASTSSVPHSLASSPLPPTHTNTHTNAAYETKFHTGSTPHLLSFLEEGREQEWRTWLS